VSATIEGRRERGRTELKESKKKKKAEEKNVRKKEEEAAEQSVFFLRFPVRSPLDRAEIWTAAFRHVTLHSERLD
jgi:hypothetical protein